MRCPPPPRVSLATDQTAAGNVGQRRRLAVAQRNVNVLAPPCPGPGKQCRHNAVTRVQARRQIRHGNTHLDRRTVPRAGNMHEPELGLDHDVVPGAVGVGPRLTVPGDGRVDQSRVDAAEGFVVHAILLQGAREVVLHEDVALQRELLQNAHALLVLEGHADGFLIAVYLARGRIELR